MTEYPAGAQPLWMSDAGNGALWFTDNTDHELVRFDISTHATTVAFQCPGSNAVTPLRTPGLLW